MPPHGLRYVTPVVPKLSIGKLDENHAHLRAMVPEKSTERERRGDANSIAAVGETPEVDRGEYSIVPPYRPSNNHIDGKAFRR
jgi:hypothetical protein